MLELLLLQSDSTLEARSFSFVVVAGVILVEKGLEEEKGETRVFVMGAVVDSEFPVLVTIFLVVVAVLPVFRFRFRFVLGLVVILWRLLVTVVSVVVGVTLRFVVVFMVGSCVTCVVEFPAFTKELTTGSTDFLLRREGIPLQVLWWRTSKSLKKKN